MIDYRADPAVHIFGDSAPAVARLAAAAGEAGLRIASARTLEADALGDLAPGAALLIVLENEGAGEAAGDLFDRVSAEVGRERRAIVSVPLGLLDLAAALAAHPAIALLCEPDGEAWRAAMAGLRAPPGAGVAEGKRDGLSLLLPARPEDDLAPFGAAEAREAAAFLRAMLRARRMRDDYFRSGLFADPVWDLLLDLMAARLEGTKVSVSSLCVAAAVPPTTALRWINRLTAEGLLLRDADPEDRRRVHLELSERTARSLGAWLRRVRESRA